MSVREFLSQTNGGFYSLKPLLCVLPQIMPDVTSLRAEASVWSGTGPAVFTDCVCVPVNFQCIPHRRVARSDDGTLVWEVGSRGVVLQLPCPSPQIRLSLHLGCTHPPTHTIRSTNGICFDRFNCVAREHNIYFFSVCAWVSVSYQQWIY